MFTKYDINDLYLAYVLVTLPTNKHSDTFASYGYFTILKKNEENYTDLQNMDRIVTTTRKPNERSYVIYEIEPLSKYYTQDGKKISKFTRKNAVNVGQKYNYVITKKMIEKTKTI